MSRRGDMRGSQWAQQRQRGLYSWLRRRLERYGDSVETLEADLVAALNASADRPQFGVPSGAPRIYDGSTWEDNPHVEPAAEPVILSFPSPQAAG